MASGFSIEMPTKGLDELFKAQYVRDDEAREKVQIIPFDMIDDFPDHPFEVRQDAEMEKMIESVKEYGILIPGLVRPKPDGRYELIAGHRRKFAAQAACLKGFPAIVRAMELDAATIIMVDSNLQREHVLPSEKAFAYKMKMDAVKRQGARMDLTSCQVGTKLNGSRTDELIAENTDVSARQVQRYIRLTKLIPQIRTMVDECKIAFSPAVELSYLSPEKQKLLYEIMGTVESSPSHAQAIRLKQHEQENFLTKEIMHKIMSEEKGNQIIQYRISKNSIARFFPSGADNKTIESTIVKALEMYVHQRDRVSYERSQGDRVR